MVNLTHYLFLIGFNGIRNHTFSKDLLDSNCKEGKELFDAMDEIMEFMEKPNVAGFLSLRNEEKHDHSHGQDFANWGRVCAKEARSTS